MQMLLDQLLDFLAHRRRRRQIKSIDRLCLGRSQCHPTLERRQVWQLGFKLWFVPQQVRGSIVRRDLDRCVTGEVRIAMNQHRLAAGCRQLLFDRFGCINWCHKLLAFLQWRQVLSHMSYSAHLRESSQGEFRPHSQFWRLAYDQGKWRFWRSH